MTIALTKINVLKDAKAALQKNTYAQKKIKLQVKENKKATINK